MIELKNIYFNYNTIAEECNCEYSKENSGRSQSDRPAGGIGETVSNGSLKNINLKINEDEFVLLTGGS